MLKSIQKALEAPLFRYLAPFMALLIFGELQRGALPETVFWLYGLKMILVGLVTWFCFRHHLKEIEGRIDRGAWIVGLVVFILWILSCHWMPKDPTITFNPDVFSGNLSRFLAILTRALGMCLIIPIVEELFFRSFLMRFLVKEDFLSVRLGTYKLFAFSFTAVAFTVLHRGWEWPGALIAAILYGGYLVKTQNLLGCILAHAVTNVLLVIYILVTKQWYLW